MQVDGERSSIRPWLLRGPSCPGDAFQRAFIKSAQLLDEINKLRAKNHTNLLDESPSADDLMRSALLMVRTKMVRRGAPTDMANIYKMDDAEARQWIKAFEKESKVTARCDDSSESDQYELGKVKPPQTDIIGYVRRETSRSHVARALPSAIPVAEYLALRKQALRLSQTSVLVKIRDQDGTTCRPAYLELLDS